MKYVDFVDRVAAAYIELARTEDFIDIDDVARSMGWGERSSESPWMAVHHALQDLALLDILDVDRMAVTMNSETRKLRSGVPLRSAWKAIAEVFLDEEQLLILGLIAEASEQRHEDWAMPMDVTLGDALASHPELIRRHHEIQSLANLGLIWYMGFLGDGAADLVRIRYAGVVRATEAVPSVWNERLRSMVDTWETPTVDFKRELSLGKPTTNAEFSRDITALANTIAPGQPRYMVLGYDPKTHVFTHPVADLDQDRLEQLLNAWAEPQPGLKLVRVEHESGLGDVVIIEVIRDPARVPYAMSKAAGKIARGEVFVRHGSHVEPPTDSEREWLAREAARARAG